ncbi:MAG: hypothetical protein ACXWQR_18450 [Ktedonobacterales bacterium]
MMTGEQHQHRWFAQNEDEPPNAYLVCIQCGEVVDPSTFLAMRELAEAVVAVERGVNNDGICGMCGAYGETPDAPIPHTSDCPVTKACTILAK